MSSDPETEPKDKQEEADDSRDEENWENEGGAIKDDATDTDESGD